MKYVARHAAAAVQGPNASSRPYRDATAGRADTDFLSARLQQQ
jgi:hypothetical protein